MSAADSAEDKKLVAEQRFPVRIRHNMVIIFFAKENGSNRVEHDG
jgi:hypothetical protein